MLLEAGHAVLRALQSSGARLVAWPGAQRRGAQRGWASPLRSRTAREAARRGTLPRMWRPISVGGRADQGDVLVIGCLARRGGAGNRLFSVGDHPPARQGSPAAPAARLRP